jgi:conjugal transfer mating pair stabilization protein TraG
MFPTLTIYTASADLNLLSAILNGVAMIANQTAMIWGFALMVSMWTIIRTITKASLTAGGGNAGSVMGLGAIDIVLPLIMAFFLTAGGLKSTVNIQSTINGKVTKVDNVPFVIGLIPSMASDLSQELGGLVKTAYQLTSADYDSISATGQGFILPMKTLLTARSAIMKMGSVDSQVRSLVGACLNTDSGPDYSTIINKVQNAGNSGATAAETLEIRGIPKTSIGALLYQASLNTTGFVTDLNPGSQSILSCPDAADVVAANISNALDSVEFQRAIQGAVNGLDNSNPAADFTFDTIMTQYGSMRRASLAIPALADGATQANAEGINILFNELVTLNMDCLRADSVNKTVCQAATTQKLDLERHNLQRAAGMESMLTYAGAFADYMMALIIGLGPVIIMFMMFSGANAGKSIYTAVHMMVWPLLVINVGAELVNGMMYVEVANFLASVTKGGYLSQSLALEAYNKFSRQIGTGSHIMASLPILMSMIFALGASSASVSVASKMGPTSTQAADVTTPVAQSASPILQNSSMATSAQGSGYSVLSETGATKAVAQNASYGQLSQQVHRSQTEEQARQKTISEGQSLTQAFTERGSLSNASRFGVDKVTAQSISNRVAASAREANGEHVSDTASSLKGNTNNSTAGLGGSLSASFGKGSASHGSGASAGVSARADTGTSATDTLNRTKSAGTSKSVESAKAVENAIGEELRTAKSEGRSTDTIKALEAMYSKQKQYSDTLSESQSNKDGSGSLDQKTNSLVSFAQSYSSESLAHSISANPAMRDFQITKGREFAANPAAKPHLDAAQVMVESGASDQVRSSPMAKDAAVRHNAAVRMFNSDKSTPEDKKTAADYLLKQGLAVTGMRQEFGSTERLVNKIDKPEDATEVETRNLDARSKNLLPTNAPDPAATPTPSSSKPNKPSTGGPASTPARSLSSKTTPTPEPQAPPAAKLSEVQLAFQKTDAAGLNQNSTSGTAARAKDNVVENVKTMVSDRPNNRTALGNLTDPKNQRK